MESIAPNYWKIFHEGVLTFYDRLLEGNYVYHSPQRKRRQPPPVGMPYHGFPEFFIQFQGVNQFCCPPDRFDLCPGEACLIPKGVAHGETVCCDETGRFSGIVLFVKENRLAFLASTGSDRGTPRVSFASSLASAEVPVVASHLDMLSSIDPSRGDRQRVRADAHLRILISSILDLLESSGGTTHPNETRAYQARNLIHARLADPTLSITELADQLACSPDHLARVFNVHLGQTPNRYIRSERLRLATTLIEAGELNLSEIASRTGFQSLSYFSRVFVRSVGYPPSEHRLRIACQ